jgi:L-lactate dehydrogenase complex protein LldG
VTAREDVLSRIRAALGTGPVGPVGPADSVKRDYRTGDDRPAGELLALLAERLSDYGALTAIVAPDGLAAAVARALAARGVRRVVVPPGLELEGPDQSEWVVDDGLTAAELDQFDAVITTAAAAIAETGTIILDGSPGQGRRALSLIPDYHLCILQAAQVVGLVPEVLARLDPGRPLTWISGPSATSDIELDRVQGVHGPRTLEVIIVAPAEASGERAGPARIGVDSGRAGAGRSDAGRPGRD